MFRAFGPDSNPKKPIILCARHALVLRHNLALFREDRAKWGSHLPPEFDPDLVQIVPAPSGLFCRNAFVPGVVPCGEASMPAE